MMFFFVQDCNTNMNILLGIEAYKGKVKRLNLFCEINIIVLERNKVLPTVFILIS